MVVGESGLGKSTLINSLFLTDIYSDKEYPGPSLRVKKTVSVETSRVLIKEGGVQLQLTIVDTPGFGDAVDNSNCWQPVIDYIDNKFEDYLNSESRVNRRSMPDNRVHSCLYFIAPTGHGLKPLDIEFMKRLHEKVNIIPLISKADTLTPDECRQFKQQIMKEIHDNKIKIYEFPEMEEDEEVKENNSKNIPAASFKRRFDTKEKETVKIKEKPSLKERVPFAVVGSNTILEVNGRKVRGRHYPWGIVEVENLEHSDFVTLRNLILRTHMQDLKDVTNNVHYENFRCRKLTQVTAGDNKPARSSKVSTKNPMAQFDEERREHEMKMKKMEAEMEQVFEMKVKEKRHKLKESEGELQKRYEQMKKSLEQQQKDLEEKRLQFEREKQNFEETQKVREEELRKRVDNAKTLDYNKKGKEKKKASLF
ncbi:septin-7-like isoform X1 [Glandiceps talaboti]